MTAPSLTRRSFLQAAALAAAWTALAACTPPAPSTLVLGSENGATPLPSNRAPGTSAELHLLRRISFGPRPGDIEHIRALGLAAFLEEQLNDTALPDIEDRLAGLTLLTASPGDLLQREKDKALNTGQVLGELVVAKFLRALYRPQQLREVMVDFWSDHFNIYALKSPTAVLLPGDQRDVIRAHALGKFRDLLAASAHSPAMLVYLDNASSVAKAPNENYAREIMELHTLGVDGGYTQFDVHDVARALTGWSVAGLQGENHAGADQAGRFIYRPYNHDHGAKQILDTKLPAGGGQSDGDKVIDILASHPSTAKFIAKKLCVRFVSDAPPQSLVDQAAATFTQSDGDIKAVLRTILNSAEFAAAAGQKFKRPFDFITSALRALEAQVTIEPADGGQPGESTRRNPIFQYLTQLGHVPFMWSTPDGYPDKTVSWLNTNGMLGRWNFGLALMSGITGISINSQALVGATNSFEELVDRAAEVLLGAPLTDQPRSIVIDFAKAAPEKARLPGVAALIIGSPQFQVR